MTDLLVGVWPACPTILTGGEDLDEEGMRAVVRFLVDHEVDGLWLHGGGGEGVVLSDEVRRGAVEVALAEAGTIPILVGISAESTRRALARYEALADLPVAGFFATPPYYYACDESEIVAFYRSLVDEIEVPVIVYNNPYVAKTAIAPDTATALAGIDGVVGLKDSSGDWIAAQAMLRVLRDISGFTVAQGYDQLAAVSLLNGADGVVTAVGTFAPRLVVQLARAARVGDATRALELQHEMLDLLDRLAWDPYSDSAFIRGTKTCLEVLGVCKSGVAAPFSPATEDERGRVARALEPLSQLTGLTS